jgi:2-dehydro-3-deoxyphosphogluconate aldolase / (4S)-4-hydroxy-2-oxoglutarate aldolase
MSTTMVTIPGATLEQLRAAQAVAVVRARDADEALHIVDALARGGLRAIELTFTTPGVAEAIGEARRRLDADVLLGAGTITAAAQADAAAAAGASFLVSPHLDPPLLDAMLATGLLCVPGVLTPSEVAGALRRGAAVVKLFPASTVGVEHLRALFGPFPGLQVVPTGGITVATARAWLDAGAAAVGLGGELLPKRLRDAGAWDDISDNAATLLAELRKGA